MQEINSLPCVLTCTGYGGTGSSAATNLLEEFSSVLSFGNCFECTFIHEADGIRDLEKALDEGHRLKVDLACKRFLNLVQRLSKQAPYKEHFSSDFYKKSLQYLNNLGIIKYDGLWDRAFEATPLSKRGKLRHKLTRGVFNTLYKNKTCNTYEPDGWQLHYYPITPCYYGNKPSNFYEETKKYLSSLLKLEQLNAKYVLIDQLLPCYDLREYSTYLHKIKTIVIDRDPRDLYALSKAEWGTRFIPTQNVDVFIEWYKATRCLNKTKQNKTKQNKTKQNKTREENFCLFMNFEELVYDYDTSLAKIKNFIGLSSAEHIKKLQCFDPNKSIRNTQIYKKCPMLGEDIKKIEIQLSDFCFDFDKYPRLDVQVYPKNYVLVEDIYAIVDNFQLHGKIAKGYKKNIVLYAFKSTELYDVACDFNQRKTLKAKVKGLIKLSILTLFFPFDFIVSFFYFLFRS